MDEKMKLAKKTFVPTNKNTYRGYVDPQMIQQTAGEPSVFSRYQSHMPQDTGCPRGQVLQVAYGSTYNKEGAH